jgi:nicotinamide-nucleotide adenylyltransferase/phosphinothricin biosynthesis protein PhpF
MDKVGVIHGRFQMLHHGHMEYLLAGKNRCEYLLIGITNPDVASTKYSNANPHRSAMLSNPLTFFERFQMIRGAMIEAGVKREAFDIIPFPINYPELLFNYAPKDAKYYMTIYDDWSREKQVSLEALGCSIDVMWTRTNSDKVTSGTEVRNCITHDQPWDHLVPKFVHNYVLDNGIDYRLKNLGLEETEKSAGNN